MSTRNRGGPLHGVRVVELTKVWAGPYVGKLLSFLGAEVIRVESMESLDVTRTYGVADINKAPGFQAVNPQKLSVQIDMKTPEGIRLLLDLLAKADIVALCVKSSDTAAAAKQIAAHGKKKPVVISFQNGVSNVEELKKARLGAVTAYSPTPRHELEHAIDAALAAAGADRLTTTVTPGAGKLFVAYGASTPPNLPPASEIVDLANVPISGSGVNAISAVNTRRPPWRSLSQPSGDEKSSVPT